MSIEALAMCLNRIASSFLASLANLAGSKPTLPLATRLATSSQVSIVPLASVRRIVRLATASPIPGVSLRTSNFICFLMIPPAFFFVFLLLIDQVPLQNPPRFENLDTHSQRVGMRVGL